jgi:hypothetical protein
MYTKIVFMLMHTYFVDIVSDLYAVYYVYSTYEV